MVELMTPELMAQYLKVFREHGAASVAFRIPLPDGSTGELSVTMEPRFEGPMPGDAPTPGGWKSPVRLDAPEQFDSVREVAP
jgi:hypothetical protein